MGTPIKQVRLFLSPRISRTLSPLPRKFLNTPKLETLERKCSRKRLDFSKESFPKNHSPYKIIVDDFDDKPTEELIINTPKKDLIINTPKKIEILNRGLNVSQNIDKLLGRGTFGNVFKGFYNGEKVAVKVLKNKGNSKEGNALKLSHENIIKTIDIISKAREKYQMVIMEFLEDSFSLQSLLDSSRGLLPEEDVRNYAENVARGLQFCHEKGILHLDVKPKNIIVCPGGVLKICDFGNSCQESPCKIGESFWTFANTPFLNNSSLNTPYVNTHSLHTLSLDTLSLDTHSLGTPSLNTPSFKLGTPAYTAPELFSGKTPTKKCDVYSFGITLWQMVHGKNPFESFENQEILIYKVVKFELRPDVETQNVENSLENLYTSCWSTCPKSRPDFKEILKDLNENF